MAKYDEKTTAEKFNLAPAEADWVTKAVERGAVAELAAMDIRSQRVGPASLPEFRPLPAEVAAEFEPEPEYVPVPDEEIEVLDE